MVRILPVCAFCFDICWQQICLVTIKNKQKRIIKRYYCSVLCLTLDPYDQQLDKSETQHTSVKLKNKTKKVTFKWKHNKTCVTLPWHDMFNISWSVSPMVLDSHSFMNSHYNSTRQSAVYLPPWHLCSTIFCEQFFQ